MLDQSAQLRGEISPVGKIEEKARERRTVLMEERHQLTRRDVGPEGLLHPKRDASPRASRADHQPHVIGGDPRIDRHIELMSVLTELPAIRRGVGLGVLPWSPLGGGVLTGKYTRADVHD
jgi:hypothetical protein